MPKPKVAEIGHFRKCSNFPALTWGDTALLALQGLLARTSARRVARWRRWGVASGVEGARISRSWELKLIVFMG
jgi:hypothetical protein